MDSRKVVVTLVCATADAEALDDVVDGLSASGCEVGLVAGVDEQPRRVAEAIERCGEFGLVVVYASSRLDGSTMRKIEGLFSARRGPNHAMVRIEASHSPSETIAAVQRAVEAFVASNGRVTRRQPTGDEHKREVVGDIPKSLALPVVRLDAGEELDGDTRRIQLPDNPKAAELSRRRRVAREREKERERITGSHHVLDESHRVAPRVTSGPNPDLLMIIIVVGAGVLAVVGALMFSGVF